MVKEPTTRPGFPWRVVRDLQLRPLFDTAYAAELLISEDGTREPDATPEWVADQINTLAVAFAFDRWMETQPTPRQQAIHARRLADACAKVLEEAGFGTAEPTPEGLLPFLGSGGLFALAAYRGEWSGSAATMNAMRAVFLLGRDARGLVNRMEATKRRRGRDEAKAIKKLVMGLSALIFRTWGEESGISVGIDPAPSGRLVRVSMCVMKALKSRGVVFPFSPHSIKSIFYGIDIDDRSWGIPKNDKSAR